MEAPINNDPFQLVPYLFGSAIKAGAELVPFILYPHEPQSNERN